MRTIRSIGLGLGLAIGVVVSAQAAEPFKIGVMNDQTGIFSDLAGLGSVIAAP